jgi:hypothetical protein
MYPNYSPTSRTTKHGHHPTRDFSEIQSKTVVALRTDLPRKLTLSYLRMSRGRLEPQAAENFAGLKCEFGGVGGGIRVVDCP